MYLFYSLSLSLSHIHQSTYRQILKTRVVVFLRDFTVARSQMSLVMEAILVLMVPVWIKLTMIGSDGSGEAL
jgi:hypothetical protein